MENQAREFNWKGQRGCHKNLKTSQFIDHFS